MALTPAQHQVLDLLRRPPAEAAPCFSPGLAEHLYHRLHQDLADVVPGASLPEGGLWVSKHDLRSVHGCEELHVHQRGEPFAWSVANARGTVVHKAIELSVTWTGEAYPLELVDEAIARLADGRTGLGDHLDGLTTAERAELRAQCNELVAKFLEGFPPLERSWVPVTETGVRAGLFDGAVVLSGRVDLTLGRADPERPGKVLLDVKTGRADPGHRDDLRFYALLETLKHGVPPRLLATLYLDVAYTDTTALEREAVTEALLEAAVARTVDGVRRMVALHQGDVAVRRAGPPCGWCPRRTTCPDGQAWLAEVAAR